MCLPGQKIISFYMTAQEAKAKQNRPLRTSIHPTRIIAYLVQLAIVIFMYDFLRNHFMMLVFCVVVAAPILDIIALIFIYKGTSVDLEAPERYVNHWGIGYLKLKLKNRSFMVSMDTNVKLFAENTFYGDKSSMIISLPCAARTTYEKQLPVRYTMNGAYRYTITEFTIRDFLGFISLKKKADAMAEVNVYPDGKSYVSFDLNDMSRGMTESEETMKKGHDFSDVSDVREYIPGDKLMSIHWKLSAKRDILMVKDRVAMSDQQMIILMDIAGTDEQVDEVLSLTYSIIDRFVREQTYVRLTWWSEGKYEFEERQIMNLEDLREAFGDVYFEKIYPDPELTKGYMRSIRPELKAYVNVCVKNGEPGAFVVEQD